MIIGCVFLGNRAIFGGNNLGGGMRNIDNSNPTVVNCTFTQNLAETRGGGMANIDSNPMVTNCIFWENSVNGVMDESAQIHDDAGSASVVRFSLIQDCTTFCADPNDGNIDCDPQFVNAGAGDLHLSAGSCCIDAGDPNFVPWSPCAKDMDGEKRIWNGRVDMGADEFGSFRFGDLNCDGAFDGADIDAFFLALGDPPDYEIRFPNCDRLLADMNCDGAVDGADIDAFFACLGFGDCSCP